MVRKSILTALAGTAILCAGAAVAGPGGGGGGGRGGGGPPSGMGGMGNAGGFGNMGGLGNAGGLGNGGMGNVGGLGNDNGVTTRDQARANGQGPANASATGIANANMNSVLAGTAATSTVTAGALAGLTAGMTLFSNGTAVGTVQQIRTNGHGNVVLVLVKGTNGGIFPIPASKLTLSGGTLTTMARLNGINNVHSTTFTNPAIGHSQALMHASSTGIAHANFHSVLAGGTVVSGHLAGLTTGLTVNTAHGTTLGTISRIVTDSSGNLRLVIVTSSTGHTFRLMPTSLSLSGGVVTTTQTFG